MEVTDSCLISRHYVGYYKKNEMNEGDNPPVGILLCTDKGSQMVEYALSGMDNQLFVSTYMLHLPDKKKLEEFMLKEKKWEFKDEHFVDNGLECFLRTQKYVDLSIWILVEKIWSTQYNFYASCK